MYLPGFSVIVAFCYDMVYKLCDGFSDLLQVLLEFYASLGFAFCFLTSACVFSFKFSLWVGSFLAMFGDLRMTVLLL